MNFPQDQMFNGRETRALNSNEDRVRKGKTAKDTKAGCQTQNHQNKLARAAWSKGDEKEFPAGTCNGKKSRKLRGEK